MGEKESKLLKPIEVLEELDRKVDLTRRSRIKASQRLRGKDHYFGKISHLYSLLVLVFSIWFIVTPNELVGIKATKILLIISLSLLFFSMFLGMKNYKERANNFEINYQQLNVLLHKIQRLKTSPENITIAKLKELHREYEKLIIDKENHQNIDYMTCNDELVIKFKSEITKYRVFDKIKKILVAIYPLILMVIVIMVERLVNLFIP